MRKKLLIFFGIFTIFIAGLSFIHTGHTLAVGDVTVETVPGKSLLQILIENLHHSWSWYVIRSAGIVAALSLFLLILSGIGSMTGHMYKILEPLTSWATHRALGITFVVSVLVHILVILFDKFQPFSLAEILVPWLSDYRPVRFGPFKVGSLWVATGILALYFAILVLITSLKWVDKKPKQWKIIHFSSYIILGLVFFHGLFLGTDTGKGLGRILWIIGGVLILLAIVARLKRTNTT